MSQPQSLIAGSRQSPLALAQTEYVIAELKKAIPELEIELKTYSTQGDRILDVPLAQVGDKGMFVKELENALLAGEIDFAVHSMKDMPAEQPEGLLLVPFGKRENPFDVLVSTTNTSFEKLPTGSRIGTSSIRREAMLKNLRSDLEYVSIRGNVQTRLKKLDSGEFDAIILAAAGLYRLGLENRITQVFSVNQLVPACCQGILGVEFADLKFAALFESLTLLNTQVAFNAERAFLKTIEGGCQTPMGAYAHQIQDDQYRLDAWLCQTETEQIIKQVQSFSWAEAQRVGEQVAVTMRQQSI